ncbi:MAG: hypothetical protein WCC66_16355 [Rhizobiaceae bacterium]
MDWPMIMERNRERLMAALAPLFAVLGFDPSRAAAMPRSFYREMLSLLRPAESAVRRLIVIAARGLAVRLRPSRPFPAGLNLASDGTDSASGRTPAFCLIDPLKRFAAPQADWAEEPDTVQVLPRISVPGLFDPRFAVPVPEPSDDDIIDAGALRRRILALQSALANLQRQAMRLARWKARGQLAQQNSLRVKPGRLSPLRPGFAPGRQRRDPRAIDSILGDCHHFAIEAWAWEAWNAPDTS